MVYFEKQRKLLTSRARYCILIMAYNILTVKENLVMDESKNRKQNKVSVDSHVLCTTSACYSSQQMMSICCFFKWSK